MRHWTTTVVTLPVLALLGCVRSASTSRIASQEPLTEASELGGAADSMLSRYAMYGMSGSILLSDSGRVVLRRGYGEADRERGDPATADTRYDIGSITKTFTAAAVLHLVSQGRVRLDEPIASALGHPSGDSGVTIHQALTHTAGFPLDPADAGVVPTDSPDEYIAKVLRYDQSRTRGTYSYSNTGYGLLAILVERVSGRPFRQFVGESLIVPAGLSATGWWEDSLSLQRPGVARGYMMDDREGALAPEPSLVHATDPAPLWSKWPLGAAGIVSTVGDLHRWMTALEMGRVLPDSLRRAAFTPEPGNAGNQGYGWTISEHRELGRRTYRGGARGGFTSLLASYPRRRAHIVFALNQSQDAQWQSLVWTGLERLLGGVRTPLPPATVSMTHAELERFVGSYRIGDGGRIRVIRDGDELLVGGEGQEAIDVLLHRGAIAADSVTNRRSLAVLRAATDAASTDSALSWVNNAEGLKTWLLGKLRPAVQPEVLGTAPHPSGRERTQTFVRLGGDPSAPVLRLIWDKGKVLGWGEGIRLPALRRFRPTSRDSAVAFTAREPAWTTIVIADRDDAATQLVVVAPSGSRSGPAVRMR